MNAKILTLIRNGSFSALGLVLLAYALAVLWSGRPDPVPSLIPAFAGIATGIIVTVTAFLGDRNAAAITWDELTRSEWARSLRGGYWVAVWLYAVFGVLLYTDVVTGPQAFAAMGTLTGAAPFLFFLRSWLRGRA